VRLKSLSDLPLSLRRQNSAKLVKEEVGVKLEAPRTANKFNAVSVDADGEHFDSISEYGRYKDLKLLERAREIRDLKVKPVFKFEISGILVCSYEADYSYMEGKTGQLVVEDVKGVRTAVFIIKKKLMKALYGIEVKEIKV